jgi:Ni/Co efflux regulator RcnB
MKKLILVFALCAIGLFCQTTTAQVRFNVNIASQPIWGPVGYDHVDYYYLPDIEAYYNVPRHRYYYMENNRWRSGSNLPSRYRGTDLYNTRKVVVNEPKPYLNHQTYKSKYGSSNERYSGQSIRDSRDSRYFANKNHPEYRNWRNSQRNHRQNQQ